MKGKQRKRFLENIYDPKNNSFTVLSLLLSLMIIYYHCYYLFYGPLTSKFDIFSCIFEGENTGSIVVYSFAIISGFMITASIKNSKNIRSYLAKRIKRIIPGYALVLIISALVLAPIISPVSFKDYYLTPSNYISYIFDNLLLIKNSVYGIANIFTSNAYPVAINGSIWYIKHQFFCYLYIIPIFWIFIKNGDKKEYDFKYLFLLILILTIMSYFGSFVGLFRIIKDTIGYFGIFNEIEMLVKIVYYFSAGIFMNIYKDKILYDKKNLIYLSLILLLTFRTKVFPFACLFLLPYFVIFIGTLKSGLKLIDISYYIFLVGFPVQQAIFYYLNGKINIFSYIVLSLVISVICGYIVYLIVDLLPKRIKHVIKKKEVIKNEI